MQQIITGKAFVLGDNVDTDQIIPAQYLTFNPSIPAEYKMFGKYALSSVPAAQSGLPKGHVPFHTDDEFVSPYKIIVGRQELRLRLVPRARPDRPGGGRHQGRRRRVLRPHLLPQRGQRRLPDPARVEEAADRGDLHRRRADARPAEPACCTNRTTGDTWELLGRWATWRRSSRPAGIFEYAKKVGMLKG